MLLSLGKDLHFLKMSDFLIIYHKHCMNIHEFGTHHKSCVNLWYILANIFYYEAASYWLQQYFKPIRRQETRIDDRQCTMGFDPTIWAEKSTFFIWTVPLEMTSAPTRYGIREGLTRKKKKCEISHLGGQNWVIFTLFLFFSFMS